MVSSSTRLLRVGAVVAVSLMLGWALSMTGCSGQPGEGSGVAARDEKVTGQEDAVLTSPPNVPPPITRKHEIGRAHV